MNQTTAETRPLVPPSKFHFRIKVSNFASLPEGIPELEEPPGEQPQPAGEKIIDNLESVGINGLTQGLLDAGYSIIGWGYKKQRNRQAFHAHFFWEKPGERKVDPAALKGFEQLTSDRTFAHANGWKNPDDSTSLLLVGRQDDPPKILLALLLALEA